MTWSKILLGFFYSVGVHSKFYRTPNAPMVNDGMKRTHLRISNFQIYSPLDGLSDDRERR
jgi:hypothetical protein